MSLRHVSALSLLIVGAPVLADSLDFNLRGDAAQLQYAAALGHDSLKSSQLHAGFLKKDNGDWFGDFGLLVRGPVGTEDSGVTAGVGLKAVAASVRDHDATALALGGELRFAVPAVPRLGVVGQIYAAPNVVAYRDAQRFLETSARVEYELIPQATVYVGYRRIKFDLKTQSDVVLDSGFHAGVRLSF